MEEVFNAKNLYAALCVLAGLSPIFFAVFDVLTKRKK